ncbi:LPS export ABC transporter permease LptF [Dyella nitratireducens]|uniref:Lipopolysaccharide export system permease protein LptF n=1 Tax=Dyella nitratireducens TaxID=1849580 RepID=A0ABQ1FMX1_9GAMM|nr:LPS export ABC transporter permease LptF [Dyella nitratireducens]GGA23078.1 LPS export ABC transporter permease LptF [Dyella nitratireducens]GLQ44022.1 LPS export ABC transporter permease LptF [Dyella nitratireducens]
MLSILDRYFLRELGTTIGATVVVLLVIMAGTTFAHVLEQVAKGSFPASVMFQVLGLNMVDTLSSMLPLAGFLGVLQTFGRMYRESEMHVLASSGMGMGGLLRPMAIVAVIMLVLVSAVSMWLGPWSARTSDNLVAAANRSIIAAGLDAGRFTELPGKGGIILVDTLSRDGQKLGRTFIAAERTNKDGSLVMKMATGQHGNLYSNSDSSNRYLALYDGWQYEIPLGADNWRRMKYERNDSALSAIQSDDETDPIHNLDMSDLLRNTTPDARAEFAWRTVVPLMTLALLMLAMPLSKQTPREPRYGRMLIAVLGFFLYYNLLALCRGQLAKGHWHHATPMWLLSLGLFAIAAWNFRNQYAARAPRKARA